jgi:hypothetical protein
MNSQYAVLTQFSPYGGYSDPGGLSHSRHTRPYRTYSPPSILPRPSPHPHHFRNPRQFNLDMASMPSPEAMAAMQRLSDNYTPDIQVSVESCANCKHH